MAGLDMFTGAAGDLLSQIWLAGPLLLLLLAAVFVSAFVWMWSSRRGVFYWRDSIPAPIVICPEGRDKVPIPLPGGDRFRKTTDGGKEIYESKTFRERFPSNLISDYVIYRRSGKKEYPEFLPLVRSGKSLWQPLNVYLKKPVIANEAGEPMVGEWIGGLSPDDVVKANEGIPLMMQAINDYYAKGILEQLAPYAMFALSVIGIIVVVLIATQFLTAVLTQHLGAISASTQAQVDLTNAIINMTSGGRALPPV